MYLSDDLLNETISHLLSQMGSNGQKPDVVRTYMQTIGLVSRAVGWRFGRHLAVAVPLVIRYCGEAKEGDDELREFCLQALESFVLRLVIAFALGHGKFTYTMLQHLCQHGTQHSSRVMADAMPVLTLPSTRPRQITSNCDWEQLGV